MPDPIITPSMLILALLAGAALTIGLLKMSTIRDYLRRIKSKNNIREDAFIVKKLLSTGEFRVITGFFEPNGKISVEKAQSWQAQKIDNSTIALPEGEILVLKNSSI